MPEGFSICLSEHVSFQNTLFRSSMQLSWTAYMANASAAGSLSSFVLLMVTCLSST